MKHMKQLKIVGNKYFKPEKGPNLLTWSEKEQIQYLHNSDDTVWTVEKLAQCFPASETTIKKILKSKWRPLDANRLLKHDLAVQKNWELLRSGKVEVDSELKAHLSNFTPRRIPVSHRPDTGGMFGGANSIPKPKQSEFGSIIESYKLLKNKDMPEDEREDPYVLQRTGDTSTVPKGDSFLLQGREPYSRYGGVTLDKYRERILRAVKKGRENSPDAKFMVSGLKKHEDVPETVHDASSNFATETMSDPSAAPSPLVVETNSDLPEDPPERIRVPADKWKEGCTFKIGDCYYDDDGEFLYRVPGMK